MNLIQRLKEKLLIMILNLYNLTFEHQRLLSELYNHETGEVNELVEAQLNALAPLVNDKCIAVAHWIKKIEANKRELEHIKEEINKREETYNNAINRWYDYLKSNMEKCGLKKVECPYFTIKIRNNPISTTIINEFDIPAKYLITKEITKVVTVPDKNAIKEEVLKTGKQIPGTNVSKKTKIEIIIDKL